MVYDVTANLERTRKDIEKQKEIQWPPDYHVEKVGKNAGCAYIRCRCKMGDHEYMTSVYSSRIPELGIQVGDVVRVTKREIIIVSKGTILDYQI